MSVTVVHNLGLNGMKNHEDTNYLTNIGTTYTLMSYGEAMTT